MQDIKVNSLQITISNLYVCLKYPWQFWQCNSIAVLQEEYQREVDNCWVLLQCPANLKDACKLQQYKNPGSPP